MNTVLVVSSSQASLDSLAETLRGDGYDIAVARSAETALKILTVGLIECILIELEMPGMGSMEVCRQIKSAPLFRKIPLIMLTGNEDRSAAIDGLDAGADDCISGWGDAEMLRARVRVQIRRRQSEDEDRRALTAELERKNNELEALSYSVSHDLRAPLRAIDGFSRALIEDCADKLDGNGLSYLNRVRGAAQRMAELIDDMLQLSKVTRAELSRQKLDLSSLAREIMDDMQRQDPDRHVALRIEDGLVAEADARLMRIVLENLLGNAWKFTQETGAATIELGMTTDGEPAYFVRDNGAGFDMTHVDKLFRPFQRLHTEEQYPGNGIGLAATQRVIDRHGGRVWARGEVGAGAVFYFTLPPPKANLARAA